MYRLIKKKLVIFLSMLFTLFFFINSHSDNLNQKIQKKLDSFSKQYQFTGSALTIIAPKISAVPLNFMSGQTNRVNGRPILTSDYFQIGSNTKSFIAALLIKLQTENVISLDDPITKWLPSYDKWKKITIRNLLNNNSGIPSFTGESSKFFDIFDYDKDHKFSPRDLVSFSYPFNDKTNRPVYLLFEPGTSWNYSNTNWVLAGMIAVKATGQPLNKLLKERFLKPEKLNLSNTIYLPSSYNKKIKKRLVHGYTDDAKDVTGRNMSYVHAAGAMLSSTADLAHWGYYLFHNKALTKAELNIMTSLVSTTTGKHLDVNEQSGYGMGIGFKENKAGFYWGHEGHTEGYHSIFAYYPEQDVTISVNAGGLKNSDYSILLENIMTILTNRE